MHSADSRYLLNRRIMRLLVWEAYPLLTAAILVGIMVTGVQRVDAYTYAGGALAAGVVGALAAVGFGREIRMVMVRRGADMALAAALAVGHGLLMLAAVELIKAWVRSVW